MEDIDELDIPQDAKDVMEEVADEMNFDISELQIPKNKLEELFEMFEEDKFREGLKQAFKQLD